MIIANHDTNTAEANLCLPLDRAKRQNPLQMLMKLADPLKVPVRHLRQLIELPPRGQLFQAV